MINVGNFLENMYDNYFRVKKGKKTAPWENTNNQTKFLLLIIKKSKEMILQRKLKKKENSAMMAATYTREREREGGIKMIKSEEPCVKSKVAHGFIINLIIYSRRRNMFCLYIYSHTHASFLSSFSFVSIPTNAPFFSLILSVPPLKLCYQSS